MEVSHAGMITITDGEKRSSIKIPYPYLGFRLGGKVKSFADFLTRAMMSLLYDEISFHHSEGSSHGLFII